jgi:hypothetical protein
MKEFVGALNTVLSWVAGYNARRVGDDTRNERRILSSTVGEFQNQRDPQSNEELTGQSFKLSGAHVSVDLN